jgi:hypothetical protein
VVETVTLPAVPRCPVCGDPVSREGQIYCRPEHRKKAAYLAKKGQSGVLHQTPPKPKKHASQVIEIVTPIRRIFPISEIGPLKVVVVNEVTLKVTDGGNVRQEGSHGQWGGSNVQRARAWMMCLDWVVGTHQQWVVRVGNLAYGPVTLSRAKKAALAIVQGGFEDPLRIVRDPLGELHVAQAGIVDNKQWADLRARKADDPAELARINRAAERRMPPDD